MSGIEQNLSKHFAKEIFIQEATSFSILRRTKSKHVLASSNESCPVSDSWMLIDKCILASFWSEYL